MRIEHLHINRFGHFSDCDIELKGSGFHLLFGPNEAGKTTLLQFLRGLLFDFPTRTPYDFGGSGDLAGIGTMTLADGRRIELRRRKGLKNKIAFKIDDQQTDMDDAGLRRLFGHADRDLFESIFAFGLEQLSQGEASLKHDNLQSALFGGSLGGTASPDRILAELDRQSAELFKSGKATRPTINALLDELKQTQRTIKEKSLRSDEYRRREDAAAQAKETAARLQTEVEQLRLQYMSTDRLVRAWPKWWEWKQRCEERSKLPTPKKLSPNAVQRLESLLESIQTNDIERTKLVSKIELADRELAELPLDPRATSFKAEIKACLEMKQSAAEARRDLPERIRHKETKSREIDNELSELRPGWSHADLKAFSIDASTRFEIERWDDEHHDRSTERTKLTTKRDAEIENLDRFKSELANCGEAIDTAPLVAILSEETSYASCRQKREAAIAELGRLKNKQALQLTKLAPLLTSHEQLAHPLPVLRTETVNEISAAQSELADLIRSTTESLTEDELELHALDEQWSTLSIDESVPTLEQRMSARQRRDEGWNLIRRQYIDGTPAPTATKSWLGSSELVLTDAYEQTVRNADAIADRIYDNADVVARREALKEQREALTNRIEQKRARKREFEQTRDELITDWKKRWQPCGFEPLAPEAMLKWLDDYDAYQAITNECRDKDDSLRLLDQQMADFENRLQKVCTSPLLNRLSNDDVKTRLVSCKQAVDAAKSKQQKESEARNEITRLTAQLEKIDSQWERLTKQDESAAGQWLSLLGRLKLPTDWSPAVARSIIEKLMGTRKTLDSLPDEDARINAMESRVKEFDDRVHKLCDSIAPELKREPTELAVEKLAEQLEQAAQAQQKHDRLASDVATYRESLVKIDKQLSQWQTQRIELLKQADVETDDEFFQVAQHVQKVEELDREIEVLAREIHAIRAGEEFEQFEKALLEVEHDKLVHRHGELGDTLRSTEQLWKQAEGDAAVAQSELSRLDGSTEVALLLDEQSRKRSQLAAEVERYVPIILARNLLSNAVKRFERENQPAMIETVSKLLHQMSAGRYIEFDRTAGDTQGMIIRRSDGVERTPDQLSTGTREQLYLAIRLAYVLHYCEQSEPLPIVMDDVLVNFDEARTKQTLKTLVDISKTVQILFFTCHPHMISLAREVLPGLKPTELPTIRT